MTSQKQVPRGKPLPEGKVKTVAELTNKMNESRTVLIASCRGLPGRQFHDIKKKLRSRADMRAAKKSSILRAIDNVEKGAIKNLKKNVDADIVVLFSDLDAFELSGILTESQSSRKAKAGDIAPEDIVIEPGPTDLPPGPAISELSGVGLKVAVKEGKLEIMQGATVTKKGNAIDEKVASVLGKLNISPMKVGFIPVAAYDRESDAVYENIVIDKKGTLENMRSMIGKALGFAVGIRFPVKETISFLISKAAIEEKAIAKIVNEKSDAPAPAEQPAEEASEEQTETKTEAAESNGEEKIEESNDQTGTKEEGQ